MTSQSASIVSPDVHCYIADKGQLPRDPQFFQKIAGNQRKRTRKSAYGITSPRMVNENYRVSILVTSRIYPFQPPDSPHLSCHQNSTFHRGIENVSYWK